MLLDGVDVSGTTVRDALGKLDGIPVYDISSERYVWSLNGAVGDTLSAARPGQFNGVMLVGGRHIDAAQGGNLLLQVAEYLIAGISKPENSQGSKVLAAGWISDMFDGTKDSGIYGDPYEAVAIPTPSGTATAIVLPFVSEKTVIGMPWDGIADVILKVVFGLAGYDLSAKPASPTVVLPAPDTVAA